LSIENALYGFAGLNVMFKMFLTMYISKETAHYVLDTLVIYAKSNRIQFSIISYSDEELRLFSYSPPSEDYQEIMRLSSDPAIPKGYYAIGSGGNSKMYKKHKTELCPTIPIRKIIKANIEGLRKQGMLDLENILAKRPLTQEESRDAFRACSRKGGDLLTGGEIKVCQNTEKVNLAKQIEIMDKMDQQAKAQGAVCASPFNANAEVIKLNSLGQYSVSPNEIKVDAERRILLDKMDEIFKGSI
jgi:hypothetical protein